MRTLASSGFLFIGLGALFILACSDEPNTQTDATSASASTSGTGGSGGGTGGSGGGMGGSGGVAVDPVAYKACLDHCAKLQSLGCPWIVGADCNAICDDSFQNYVPPECADEAAIESQCMVQNLMTCEDIVCQNEHADLMSCRKAYSCVQDGCTGGPGNGQWTCGCQEVCKNKNLSTSCTTPEGGTMTTCDCLIDGVSVGTCQEPWQGGGCLPRESCCSSYFNL